MLYKIDIKTKNRKVIKSYLNFINELKKEPYFKTLKLFESVKKNKQKKFTVLKSPHINKTAREQIGYKVHTKTLYIFTTQIELLSFILKKIKQNLFYDLSINITLIQRKYIFIFIYAELLNY